MRSHGTSMIVAGVSIPVANMTVRVFGAPVIPNALNVATPAAAAVDDPVSVPPPESRLAVITFVADVTMLLDASRTSITGCVAYSELSPPPNGRVRKVSAAGAPGCRSNGALITGDILAVLNDTVRGPTRPVMVRPGNVTVPADDTAVVGPDSVPPPLANETVTDALAVLARLPAASRNSRNGGESNATPALAPDGCVTRIKRATTPGSTVTEDVPITPFARAVIVAVPMVVAVITPFDAMLAIVASLELHSITGALTTCARLSVTRAMSCSVVPD